MQLVTWKALCFAIALLLSKSASRSQELPINSGSSNPPPVIASGDIWNRFEKFTPKAKAAVLNAARLHGMKSVEYVFSAHGYYVSVFGDTSRSNKLEVYTLLQLTNVFDPPPSREVNLPFPGSTLLGTAISLFRARSAPEDAITASRFSLHEKTLHTNIMVRVRDQDHWVPLKGETTPSVAEDFIMRFYPTLTKPLHVESKLVAIQRGIGNTNRFIVSFSGRGFETGYHYNLSPSGLQFLGTETRGPCTITRIGFGVPEEER